MRAQQVKFGWLILVIAGIFLGGCGSESNPMAERAKKAVSFSPKIGSDQAAPMEEARRAKEEAEGGLGVSDDRSKLPADALVPSFKVMQTDLMDRFLHYDVTLTYECPDLRVSRLHLLDLISKFGFFQSTQAALGENSEEDEIAIHAFVHSAQVVDLLKQLEAVGKLKNETIQVQDNTEAMFLAKQKASREIARGQRRSTALHGSTEVRNWSERENALSASEDQLDEAQHQQWLVKDSVQWANVNISLTTRYRAWRIEIPVYRNALIGSLELFLKVFYYALWLLPFWIVLALLLWKRETIKKWFKREK